MDKNGNVVIDPNSAMNAAKTMHASGIDLLRKVRLRNLRLE